MQELFDLGKGRSANSCKAAGFWGFNLAAPSECCALCRAVSAVKEGELSTQSPPGGVPKIHSVCGDMGCCMPAQPANAGSSVQGFM